MRERVQLLTSLDPGVRKAGDLHLVEERARQRLKFRPASLVDSILSQDHSQSRRALKKATKAILQEEEDNERYQQLCQLPEMARAWKESSPELWVKAVQGLPPEPLKFALCASTNSLPTNANLHMWRKKSSDICSLCQKYRQSLPHVLNNCSTAMDLRRYSKRHDEVLQVLGVFIRSHLPPLFSITIDSPSESYCFPHHITATNLRPDIVWWSEDRSELWLFELTISFESVVADARERKRSKYYDLVEAGRSAGFRCELITLEVGSRGMLSAADLEPLQAAIEVTRKEMDDLCLTIIRTAVLESFQIWGSRNCSI